MNLTVFLSTFILAFTSYQSVFASANKFTAKSIRSGDNLISILKDHGFTPNERSQVLSSDKRLNRLFLTLDTRYLVHRDNKKTELRMFDSQTSDAFKIIKDSKGIKAFKYDPKYKISIERVQGRVYGSLMGSILGKLKSNWVAARFIDAYAFDLNHGNQVLRGAQFWFNVEKKYEESQFVKYGEVLQTFLEVNGSPIQKKFVRYKTGGVFFNEDDLLDNKPLHAPVKYIKIASRFQPKRLHPITRRRQPHLGVDFELPIGAEIYAPQKGTVLRYGKNRAAGNFIVIRHPNGMETSYNHLQTIDSRIRKGLTVHAGERIGAVGCTGYCTRAHLHFAVKKQGRMVDPLKYIKAYPSQMEEFLEKRVAQN